MPAEVIESLMPTDRWVILKSLMHIVSGIYLQKELLSYVWLDRAGEIPKDGDDHLIDAMHYAARYLLEGQEVKYTKAPMRANKL